MSPRIQPLLTVLCLLCATAGAAPATTSSTPETVRFLGLETRMPAGWVRSEPSSSMRLAQFSARDAATGRSANVIFYYFGPGQGGSPDANIARWRSQFQGEDGAPVEPAVERIEVGGMPLTLATFQGSYARGIGMGPEGTAKPAQALIAAMLETDEGMVVIQLHGDAGFVESLEPGFVDMLQGVAPVPD